MHNHQKKNILFTRINRHYVRIYLDNGELILATRKTRAIIGNCKLLLALSAVLAIWAPVFVHTLLH